MKTYVVLNNRLDNEYSVLFLIRTSFANVYKDNIDDQ